MKKGGQSALKREKEGERLYLPSLSSCRRESNPNPKEPSKAAFQKDVSCHHPIQNIGLSIPPETHTQKDASAKSRLQGDCVLHPSNILLNLGPRGSKEYFRLQKRDLF